MCARNNFFHIFTSLSTRWAEHIMINIFRTRLTAWRDIKCSCWTRWCDVQSEVKNQTVQLMTCYIECLLNRSKRANPHDVDMENVGTTRHVRTANDEPDSCYGRGPLMTFTSPNNYPTRSITLGTAVCGIITNQSYAWCVFTAHCWCRYWSASTH